VNQVWTKTPSRERRRLGVLCVVGYECRDEDREREDRQPLPAEGFYDEEWDEEWDEECVFGYRLYALPIVKNGEHLSVF
jgi:hypothetical protein